MNIHEAMKARTKQHPFLTRAAWSGLILNEPHSQVYIQPTNTPYCCIIFSPIQKSPRRGWEPDAEDLLAEDWEVTSG